MHTDPIHQHLLDLGNKLETVEDKVDTALRVLFKIAKRLSTDDSDKEKTKQLTAELATVAAELESAVAATKSA